MKKIPDHVFNYIGLLGVFALIIAYLLLVNGVWLSSDIKYLGTNLVSSGLILFSLIRFYNLACVWTQLIFMSISIHGICKALF